MSDPEFTTSSTRVVVATFDSVEVGAPVSVAVAVTPVEAEVTVSVAVVPVVPVEVENAKSIVGTASKVNYPSDMVVSA